MGKRHSSPPVVALLRRGSLRTNSDLQLFMKEVLRYLTSLAMFLAAVVLYQYLTNKPLQKFEPRRPRHHTAANSTAG